MAVAPNQPRTIYYVLTQDRRLEASFAALYAPNGDYVRYQREAMTHAAQDRDQQWMGRLREQAGLDPKWVPNDEATRVIPLRGPDRTGDRGGLPCREVEVRGVRFP